MGVWTDLSHPERYGKVSMAYPGSVPVSQSPWLTRWRVERVLCWEHGDTAEDKGDGSPVFMSHVSWSWKPPLSHSSPHHGWFYLTVLFLSQQKAFCLFFKLRQGGGWDLPVKSKCVRRGWAGLVRGIFSYISLKKLRRKEGKSLCDATPYSLG